MARKKTVAIGLDRMTASIRFARAELKGGSKALMSAIGQYLADEAAERIRSGRNVGPDGEPWQEWSPSYAKLRAGARERAKARRKAIKAGTARPLRGDEPAYGVFSTHALKNRKMLVASMTWAADAKTARVGSNMRYAKFVQWGTLDLRTEPGKTPIMRTTGAKGVAARPFLGVSRENEEEIARMAVNWARRALRGKK